MEEMEEGERERLEQMVEAMTLARNANEMGKRSPNCANSRNRRKRWKMPSRRRGQADAAQKLLHDEGFFDQPDQRLLIFTEFKDTLDYLVENSSRGGSASARSTAG